MSSFLDGSDGKSGPKKISRPSNFSKKEKEGRGAFLGGLVGHAANAAVTALGAYLGFKAMGPAGAPLGAVASEGAKHYAGSFFSSRSSGGAASSFSNVGELKQAVATEAKRAVDEGDNSVVGAKSRLEAALQTIISATEDSGHEAVEQMKAAVELAISLCDSNVMTASQTAQQKAGAWAGGL